MKLSRLLSVLKCCCNVLDHAKGFYCILMDKTVFSNGASRVLLSTQVYRWVQYQ